MTKFTLQLPISTSESITSTFVQHPHSIDYFTTDNILQFGFCTEHCQKVFDNLIICIQKNIVVLFLYCYVNTIHVKDTLNKDLSTPLIYICSTVYKMAKILTQKYLLQSFFHIRLDTVR